jgi:hypothetical protein
MPVFRAQPTSAGRHRPAVAAWQGWFVRGGSTVSMPSSLLQSLSLWPTVATDSASASSGRFPIYIPLRPGGRPSIVPGLQARRPSEGTGRARTFLKRRLHEAIIRELKRQAAGEKLEPEQLKGLIRAGYVYRNGDEASPHRHGPARSGSTRRLHGRGATRTRRREAFEEIQRAGQAVASVCRGFQRRTPPPVRGRPAAFRQAAERCARHHLRCWRGVSAAYPRRC